jgi:DeoR family myo-inositol catabolism operon transcriptional repressor
MLKTQRIKQIHEYVLEHHTVSLDELVDIFKVSKNTIRRDVQELVDSGRLKKVYGGVSANRMKLESFHNRKVRNQIHKKEIAEKAASFVENGDVVFIDSGTTTLGMIEFLKNKEITVITNNLDFIIHSIPYENVNIISTGGILERKTKSFANFMTNELLKAHNINRAFMASSGISLVNGVTNSSPLETKIKQNVVKKSSEVYLLVDHHKFDQLGMMTYCELNEIDYLITNQTPNEDYQNYFKVHNIDLVISN